MSDSSRFGRAVGKFSIKSLDEPSKPAVTAQFNPKELQIDRSVPWTPTSDTAGTNNSAADAAATSGGIDMQFTGAKGRSLTVELLFDGVEKKDKDNSAKVSDQIGALEYLAAIRKDAPKQKEEGRRPHHCVAAWGSTLKAFRCVIESISTKYTMFDADGNPLRATCTLKLLEADSVSGQKKAAAAPAGGGGGAPAGGGGGGTAPAGGGK